MNRRKGSISTWTLRHAVIVWIGILLNLVLAVPLLFSPAWLLDALGIPLMQEIWVRFSGGLLIIISAYYVPGAMNLERYRANAWLAVIPSRSFGATFFFLAVFVFDQPFAFVLGVLVDGIIGALTLLCLIKVTALERATQQGATI